MPHRQKDPLRPLTIEEREHLVHLSRAQAEPAAMVARQGVGCGGQGCSYTQAALAAGRKSGDAVSQLVSRASIGWARQHWSPATAAVQHLSTPELRGMAYSPRCGALRTEKRTVPHRRR